jgi:hypothetical protein
MWHHRAHDNAGAALVRHLRRSRPAKRQVKTECASHYPCGPTVCYSLQLPFGGGLSCLDKSFARIAAAGGSDTRAKSACSSKPFSHCFACILIAASIATPGFLADTCLARTTHTPHHLLDRSVTLSFPPRDEHNPASGTVSQNCYGSPAIFRWLRCKPHLNTKTRVSTHTVKTRLVTSEAAKEAI